MGNFVMIMMILGIMVLLAILPAIVIDGLIKRKFLRATIVGLLCLGCILVFFYKEGEFTNTKVQGQYMQIVNSGTGSMGSSAIYSLEGSDVIMEVKKLHFGWFQHIKFGWKFKAVKPGECNIIVYESNCGDSLHYVDIYHVTVDDKLNVSYEHADVEIIEELHEYLEGGEKNREISIDMKSGESFVISDESKLERVRQVLLSVVGESAECDEPDITVMDKITVKYIRRHEGEEMENSLYLENGIIYFGRSGVQDGESAGTTWYCFEKSIFCTHDVLQELINIASK